MGNIIQEYRCSLNELKIHKAIIQVEDSAEVLKSCTFPQDIKVISAGAVACFPILLCINNKLSQGSYNFNDEHLIALIYFLNLFYELHESPKH